MDETQYKQVIKALVGFIERVSDGKTTCETEVEVLPQVVEALNHLIS